MAYDAETEKKFEYDALDFKSWANGGAIHLTGKRRSHFKPGGGEIYE